MEKPEDNVSCAENWTAHERGSVFLFLLDTEIL